MTFAFGGFYYPISRFFYQDAALDAVCVHEFEERMLASCTLRQLSLRTACASESSR